ncbi:MAG: hypothetical protein NDJ89_02745 [Oligoflexia bacterium]|nr:hypothetical protein [Oligoflexia bacterium]
MTAWKPKEKPLSLEEAVALAKRELSRYWIGSEPLLAAVRSGEKVTAHPLSADFARRDWLMLFMDPTGFSAEPALNRIEEWSQRFAGHGIGFVVVLRVPYANLRRVEALEWLLPRKQFPFILVLDAEDQLSAAFGATSARELPRMYLLVDGKPVAERSGRSWGEGVEERIQQLLWKRDPGLPLPPALPPEQSGAADIAAISFADRRQYPKPGFQVDEFGELRAGFAGATSIALEKDATPYQISGGWKLEGERLIAADETATLRLKSPGSHFAVVAELAAREPGDGEILLELEGIRMHEGLAAEDLGQDESGGSVLRVREARTYRAFKGLPNPGRELCLRFPHAREMPVALYGLRFGG